MALRQSCKTGGWCFVLLTFFILLLPMSCVTDVLSSPNDDGWRNSAVANDCLQGRQVHDLPAQDIAQLFRCFSRSSGAVISDAVLSEVEASGFDGRELVDMSEEELGDVLQLSGAHVRSLHHLLSIRWAPASAGPHAEEAHRSSAVRFEERFQLFMDAVCWRCAYANYACGCELGEENPAFEVLRNYATQYHRWREIAASPDDFDGAEEEQVKWIVIDVQNGLGNNLLAYVNGLLLAMCLGRALALNAHDLQPMLPVLDFVLEKDIPSWRGRNGGTGPASTRYLYMDQAHDLSAITCGELHELEAYDMIQLRSANQDPHLIFSNPRCGAHLHEVFRGQPFFFLSHFVWPAQQQLDSTFTFVSAPSPQQWDGTRRLRDFLALVHAAIGRDRMVGMHARICRKIPLHHYDHSHLLPHHLDLFCSGNASSLLSMSRCLRSVLAPPTQGDKGCHEREGAPPDTSAATHTSSSCASSADARGEEEEGLAAKAPRAVVLWATDNEEVTRELRREVEAIPGVVLVHMVRGEGGGGGAFRGRGVRGELGEESQEGRGTCIGTADVTDRGSCEEAHRLALMHQALADLVMLSAASVLVASPQSSFSFAAHARGLSTPMYGSFAPKGQACARGLGPEAGMLTRGRLYTRCHDEGWRLECGAEAEDCIGLLYGQNRVGRCMQEVAPCWAAAGVATESAMASRVLATPVRRVAVSDQGGDAGGAGTGAGEGVRRGGRVMHDSEGRGGDGGAATGAKGLAGGSGEFAFRVDQYLLDIDHLAFYRYWWVRHGGIMHLNFPHDPYPVCWPVPAFRR